MIVLVWTRSVNGWPFDAVVLNSGISGEAIPPVTTGNGGNSSCGNSVPFGIASSVPSSAGVMPVSSPIRTQDSRYGWLEFWS